MELQFIICIAHEELDAVVLTHAMKLSYHKSGTWICTIDVIIMHRLASDIVTKNTDFCLVATSLTEKRGFLQLLHVITVQYCFQRNPLLDIQPKYNISLFEAAGL